MPDNLLGWNPADMDMTYMYGFHSKGSLVPSHYNIPTNSRPTSPQLHNRYFGGMNILYLLLYIFFKLIPTNNSNFKILKMISFKIKIKLILFELKLKEKIVQI